MAQAGVTPVTTEVHPVVKQPHSLAILGPSMVFYSESGDAGSMRALQETALAEAAPETEWSCESSLLFVGESMAALAGKFVAGRRPNAVVLVLSAFQFTHQSACRRIHERWPRLFPAVRYVMGRMRQLAGGEGGPSPRRWLFSVPRQLALWALGGAYELTPEEFSEYVKEALVALSRTEELTVICRLPVFYWQVPKSQQTRAQLSLARVNEDLAKYCASLHIPAYDLASEARGQHLELVPAPDGLHFSEGTRRFEAETIARYVAAAHCAPR
jgi:hypothetical protein